MPGRFHVRNFALFVAGVGCGVLLMQPGAAQTKGGTKLNHVSIAVKDFDAAVSYYTKTMGFRPAFTFREPDGKPILTYLQISRETFLEIQPATPDRPAGFFHLGLETDDVKGFAARVRANGTKIGEPTLSERSGALLTMSTDPEGIRTEILELGPASTQRKAINAWK
ncbi:MAG: VOC family protein [Acidobacteriota bacterium]